MSSTLFFCEKLTRVSLYAPRKLQSSYNHISGDRRIVLPHSTLHSFALSELYLGDGYAGKRMFEAH